MEKVDFVDQREIMGRGERLGPVVSKEMWDYKVQEGRKESGTRGKMGTLGKRGLTGSPGGKGRPGPAGPPGEKGGKGIEVPK
ncbi:collagen alpha chain-like [Salvelinus sp. IW2-2015]|uniref:collagen alpha chain-like n=1 Tax=Salvelinus sp. IW2-2015 TaxID=2691554 RepID=UPI000CDFC620|nr:collagen alpha-1(I) chain-like [Salvelinus alpinus]